MTQRHHSSLFNQLHPSASWPRSRDQSRRANICHPFAPRMIFLHRFFFSSFFTSFFESQICISCNSSPDLNANAKCGQKLMNIIFAYISFWYFNLTTEVFRLLPGFFVVAVVVVGVVIALLIALVFPHRIDGMCIILQICYVS